MSLKSAVFAFVGFWFLILTVNIAWISFLIWAIYKVVMWLTSQQL